MSTFFSNPRSTKPITLTPYPPTTWFRHPDWRHPEPNLYISLRGILFALSLQMFPSGSIFHRLRTLTTKLRSEDSTKNSPSLSTFSKYRPSYYYSSSFTIKTDLSPTSLAGLPYENSASIGICPKSHNSPPSTC